MDACMRCLGDVREVAFDAFRVEILQPCERKNRSEPSKVPFLEEIYGIESLILSMNKIFSSTLIPSFDFSYVLIPSLEVTLPTPVKRLRCKA